MKSRPEDIYIHAGELATGDKTTRIHTVLGSCISITLWHPTLHIGAMCHFALPEKKTTDNLALDARYGKDCIPLFKDVLKPYKKPLSEYDGKIFGGGNMPPAHTTLPKNLTEKIDREDFHPIGDQNAAIAIELLIQEQVSIKVAHVGEFGFRRIIFDIATGDVWVHYEPYRFKDKNFTQIEGKN